VRTKLDALPKLLRGPAEIEVARSSLKDYIGEVRVDRTGMGYADLRLQRMVAGARVGNCLLTLPRARCPSPCLRDVRVHGS
jgi:hypothetical protein